jgi:hypothetical protein
LPRRGRHPGLARFQPNAARRPDQLTDLTLVGNYALQPTWADGHHTASTRSRACAKSVPCPDGRGAPAARTGRARGTSAKARVRLRLRTGLGRRAY